MKDMCAQCGMDLRKIEEENAERSTSTTKVQNKANIAMVHSIPELKVSSNVSSLHRSGQGTWQVVNTFSGGSKSGSGGRATAAKTPEAGAVG